MGKIDIKHNNYPNKCHISLLSLLNAKRESVCMQEKFNCFSMSAVSPDQQDCYYRLLGLPSREQGRGSTVKEIRQAYRQKVEELELVKNLHTPSAIRANFPRLYASFLALKNAALYAFLDAAQSCSCEESKGEAATDANIDMTMNVITRNIFSTTGVVAMEDIMMRETDNFMADLNKTFSAMKLI